MDKGQDHSHSIFTMRHPARSKVWRFVPETFGSDAKGGAQERDLGPLFRSLEQGCPVCVVQASGSSSSPKSLLFARATLPHKQRQNIFQCFRRNLFYNGCTEIIYREQDNFETEGAAFVLRLRKTYIYIYIANVPWYGWSFGMDTQHWINGTCARQVIWL